MVQQQNQVEEILRQRIEETNIKINQLMQTALAQQVQNQQQNLNKMLHRNSASGGRPQADFDNQLTAAQQHQAKPMEGAAKQQQMLISQFNNNAQKSAGGDEPPHNEYVAAEEGQIVEKMANEQMQEQRHDQMLAGLRAEEITASMGLGAQQITDLSNNANLQHLLRATNHLKIAQDEFELAKKQLQAGKGGAGNFNVYGRPDANGCEGNGSNTKSEMLRLHAQHGSAPAFGQGSASLGGDLPILNNRSSLVDERPYGHQSRQQNAGPLVHAQRGSNSNHKANFNGSNLSD